MRPAALSVGALVIYVLGAGGLHVHPDAAHSHSDGKLHSKAQPWRRHAAPGDSNCECLNWKHAYNTGLVQCGQGYEVTSVQYNGHSYDPNGYVHNKTEHINGDDPTVRSFCENFYTKLDDNKCAYMSMTVGPKKKMWGQHWCYTSIECSDKVPFTNVRMSHMVDNRTFPVPNANVRIKICEPIVDSRLADLSPGELIAYGNKRNITDPDLMLSLAYAFEDKMFYNDLHSEKHKSYYDHLKKFETEPRVFYESPEKKAKIVVHKKRVFPCKSKECANNARHSKWRVFRVPRPVGYWGVPCVEGCG